MTYFHLPKILTSLPTHTSILKFIVYTLNPVNEKKKTYDQPCIL